MPVEELKEIISSKYPAVEIFPIRKDDLVFEERVRLKCFHCRNYGTKWTCPGRLPQLDFRKIISEYEHAAVVAYKASGTTAEDVRQAGVALHRAMLGLEAELFKRNNPLAVSFIGGCCELCKDGCNRQACAFPEQARIPWDATGCNVVRSLANIGIRVDFSSQEHLSRYGLIVW